MSELDQQIQTAFQATGLILVFVTALFTLRYPQIKEDIRREIPAGDKAKEQLRAELWQSLLANCAPLVAVNGIATYLFAPISYGILMESRFSLWDFDFSRTSFALIATLVFVFLLWSSYLAVQLGRRILRAR